MNKSSNTSNYINSFFSDIDNSDCDSEEDSDTESISAWLKNNRELEADYNDFYPEIPSSVVLYFLYISLDGELERLGKETHILENGIIKKTTLNEIIDLRMTQYSKKYDLDSILKYNITAKPREILKDSSCDYLYVQDLSGDIFFKETVCVLQDLNSMFILFKEKSMPRIQISSDIINQKVLSKKKSNLKPTHCLTRKIKNNPIIKIKNQGTRRKRA